MAGMAWAAVRVVDNAVTSTNASTPLGHAWLDVALVIRDTGVTHVRIWCIDFITMQFDATYLMIDQLHYKWWKNYYDSFFFSLVFNVKSMISHSKNTTPPPPPTHTHIHNCMNVNHYTLKTKNDMAMSFILDICTDSDGNSALVLFFF